MKTASGNIHSGDADAQRLSRAKDEKVEKGERSVQAMNGDWGKILGAVSAQSDRRKVVGQSGNQVSGDARVSPLPFVSLLQG